MHHIIYKLDINWKENKTLWYIIEKRSTHLETFYEISVKCIFKIGIYLEKRMHISNKDIGSNARNFIRKSRVLLLRNPIYK